MVIISHSKNKKEEIKMEYSIATYFIYFMIIAVCGWIMEVTLQLVQKHKFSDRGFLIGPYCPIYGCGALLITIFLTKLEEYPLALFSVTILVCGVLEYFTSYIMEKMFHARWWDYTENKFNINGRVCLETIIPFGILGLILIYLVNPFIFDHLSKLSEGTLNIIAIILGVLFTIDLLISLKVISNVRRATTKFDEENPKDNTEEISQKVKEFLRGKSFLNRRLVNAFPKLTATLKKHTEKIKQKTVEMKDGITNKANEMKEDFTQRASEVKEELNQTATKVKKEFEHTSKAVRVGIKKVRNKKREK